MNHEAAIAGNNRRGAVAVVVRDQRLLVIRRSAHVVAPRAFCFPGGAIEPGETEPQALVREFREELDAAIRPLARVWQSVTPWNVELAWWQGHLALESVLSPNPAEVESIHWFTPDEMLAQRELLESNRQFLAELAVGRIELADAEL